jgi:DNA-binding transcriptional LysR family regulator
LIEILPDFLIEQPEREQVHAVYYRSSALSKRVLAFIDFIESRLTL